MQIRLLRKMQQPGAANKQRVGSLGISPFAPRPWSAKRRPARDSRGASPATPIREPSRAAVASSLRWRHYTGFGALDCRKAIL